MIKVIRSLYAPEKPKTMADVRWYHYAHTLIAIGIKWFSYLLVLSVCLIGLGLVARVVAGLIRFGYCGNF